MGANPSRLSIPVGDNEQVEALIQLPKETRSIIHGIVKDFSGTPVKNAVVKLFVQDNPYDQCSIRPITHAFTDECGQFLFGPLCPGNGYVIKVWYNNIKIRNISITPDDCETGSECLDKNYNLDEI